MKFLKLFTVLVTIILVVTCTRTLIPGLIKEDIVTKVLIIFHCIIGLRLLNLVWIVIKIDKDDRDN